LAVGSRGNLVTLQFKHFFSPFVREGDLPDGSATTMLIGLASRIFSMTVRSALLSVGVAGIGRVYGRSFIRDAIATRPGRWHLPSWFSTHHCSPASRRL